MSARLHRHALSAAIIVLALALEISTPGIRAASGPSRIVSTLPSITETLFALGLGDRVIAVSQYCRYPPQVGALPKIGTFLKPDLERIFTMKPDLVVISNQTGNLPDRLDALHVPFVAVPSATLADVTTAILRIGAAAGIEPHARRVAFELEQRLDRIRHRPAITPRPRVLLIVGRSPDSLTGIVAVGKYSYLNDLVDIAGGVNVLANAGVSPYPRISLETLLRLDPDVIVDMMDMNATESVRARRADASRKLWNALPTLHAVRNNRVYAVANEALVVPGPRVVAAAEWLAAVIREPARP